MARRKLTERTSWDDGHGAAAYLADALALAGEDGDKAVGALTAILGRLQPGPSIHPARLARNSLIHGAAGIPCTRACVPSSAAPGRSSDCPALCQSTAARSAVGSIG